MPSISTTVYPQPAYVRVEVNWADVANAVGVKVERVDCVTGVRTALRPYVAYDGDFLDLSCGFGLFWDTEPPLDTCVYYCSTAEDAAGNIVTTATAPLVTDTFTRTVVDDWSPADTGQLYTLMAAAADFDVTGTVGTQTHPAVNVLHMAFLETGSPDQDIMIDTLVPVASAATANITDWVIGRVTDTNNYYVTTLSLTTTGTLQLLIQKRVGGTLSTVAGPVTVGSGHAAADWWTIRFQVWGTQLQTRAWLKTTPEPLTWQVTGVDSSLPTGTKAGVGGRLETGNTNTLPFVLSYDNFTVNALGVPNPVVETCSNNLTVASSGMFRYGDPVRPCNDVLLLLDYNQDPSCVPTQGIFFGNMSDETYASNSGTFVPVNADTPITTSRNRLKAAATLTVVSRTFMDRDALEQLHAPGSVTFLRGPAQYGVKDRYMLAGDIDEQRPMSDHRIQPRAISIPHVTTARPWGPSQGVCGTRVQDLCDTYATLGALEASGLSWADVLRGNASPDAPKPVPTPRTWNDVNSTYANWNAVQAGNANWADLLDGP
jgi:hypothetical protein